MTNNLTDRQRGILAFIIEHLLSEQTTPSVREIAKRFGIRSSNGVVCHLNSLCKKGYLSHEEAQSRPWKILKDGEGRPFRLARHVDAANNSAIDTTPPAVADSPSVP